MAGLIIFVTCVLPVFIMGLLIKNGKGLMLLAGYNTMSAAERDKIDKKMLSKSAGNLLIRIALEFALLGVAVNFGIGWLAVISITAVCADIFVSTILINRKIAFSPETARVNKIGIIGFTAIMSAAFICAGTVFYIGEKEPDVNITDSRLEIKAMYGLNINLSDISGVTLINKSMADIGVGTRTNGYGGFGQTFKGNFSSDKLGKYMLFVKAGSSPTLLIERDDGKNIYISFKDGGQTEILCDKLIKILY